MIKKYGTTVVLALAFIALGFISVAVAWWKAAGLDYVQGQIPYLISGGITSLALVGLGSSLLLYEAGRRARLRLEARIDELIDAVRTSGGSTAAAVEEIKVAPEESLALARENNLVVVGRSSFHKPDCRLLTGKESFDFASAEEAHARGLAPCRVCDPTAPDTRRVRRATARAPR